MIGQMAIGMALLAFNKVGCSVTTIFLLMHHFLHRFSKFSKKSLNFLQNAPFFLAL